MGRVIAAQLAADGFDVAVAYAGTVEEADATVKEIARHGRRGAAFAADTAEEEAASDLFDAVEDRFGHVDVVVHTAGINRPAALVDLDLADFDEIRRSTCGARSSSTSKPRGGCGGATAAARVAETGKRVLMLERGDFLPRERDNWSSEAVFGDGKYTADETFYDSRDRPFRPELHYYVGGNSKVYGAALLRLRPSDFGEVRHPAGVAPAWPLSYDDMEPYYVCAEHLFWAHGQHGEDPFAGVSSKDYQYPPVQHEPRIQQLSDGLAEFGLHPFHLPLGVPDGAIRLALQPDNNTEGLTRLRRAFQAMLAKLGMADTTFVRSLYLHKAFDAAATAHQAGTARFGTDPATSVLDGHCKAHDLDNLYVVDASFMPSIGAVNPTLTIIANALRVGDHIAERIGATRHPRPGIVPTQFLPAP
jgi:choline dehydrogenase-like flavoprotein